MEQYLYLDIETIPGQAPGLRDEIAKTITAPGNYKKPESIGEWERENKPSLVDEAWRKTGLDGAFGQIVVASFAVGDAEPVTACIAEWSADDAEARLLAELHASLPQHVRRSDELALSVVGHNVADFDLRFIVQRSIVRGIRPHPVLARAAQAKPWESDKVYDTMVQWAGAKNRISLDKLCLALGLPGKGEIDGSKVWGYVRAGKIAEVAAYCEDDVRKVRDIHRRMTFQAAPNVDLLKQAA